MNVDVEGFPLRGLWGYAEGVVGYGRRHSPNSRES